LTAPPSPLAPTAPASEPASEQAATYPPTLAMALLAFHRNVGPIRKESQAKYGAFADLRTVLEAITPPLLDQGLVLTQCMDSAADGASLLRTELTHAPTGEQIRSTCLIPSLQSLLDRVHQLRGEVLQRFPLDLQLAAIGALPPLMPPRNPDPASDLSPPAPRQPGLRIDDQLKGLYTLLGQLGTTVNPLHSLGGTITYLRRYQVLTLLSLAPADDDGAFDRQGPAPAQAVQQAPPPAASRPRRSSSKQESTATPRPQPTPPAPAPEAQAPEAQAPTAQAAEAQAPTVQAPAPKAAPQTAPQVAQPPAQPSPPPAVAEQELSAAEVQQLIGLIRTLPTERVAALAQAFRDQYGLHSSQLVSDYIKTPTHAAFIRQQVDQLQPLEAAIGG